MSLKPLQFRGVECEVCGATFNDMGGFRGHTADGQPCPGGTPA